MFNPLTPCLQVLPRQTCKLFSYHYSLESYQGGLERHLLKEEKGLKEQDEANSVFRMSSAAFKFRLVWGLYNNVSINLQIRERLETNPVNAVALHAITSAWSLICLVVVCKSASAYLLHIMYH